MTSRYDRLVAKLRELFQLDQPELDFGIYRILHARSGEITAFLENDLLPQVKAALATYQPADKAALQRELGEACAQALALGADPDTLPKVQQLRARLETEAVDVTALEADVYDHLYRFFSRYYQEGDFISLRRYKEGVYAIPYEGEEVKLHWANHDQYYIKTAEYLRDYAFRLRPDEAANPMRVHFRLVDAAEGEHDNVKEAEGKKRVFALAGGDFIAKEPGENGVPELVIRFEYLPATVADWPETLRSGKDKPPSQKDLLDAAVESVLASKDPALVRWISALGERHRKSSGELADYSRLRAHLDRYAARNTFDYFIHKDLGGFLRRELDFYLKSEVMRLDDIDEETAPRVEQYLSKIKVIRRIALKIIEFLAQLEDFQKKLWLKKKFVTETSWFVSIATILDIEDEAIRNELLAKVASNDNQRAEWVMLHSIDELKGDLEHPAYSEPMAVEFVAAYPTLMLDTRHFDEAFVARLLDALGDLDGLIDGGLFHSENFQALSLMEARYREQAKCIYIDPPYNTAASEIVYKNDYKHSSWIQLLDDRLRLAKRLLNDSSAVCVAIDDAELSNLRDRLDAVLGCGKHLSTVAVRSNPHGRAMASGFSANHEYALFYASGFASEIGRLPRDESRMSRYPHTDATGPYTWLNFRKSGADSTRRDRPKQYYPVYLSDSGKLRVPRLGEFSGGTWTIEDQPSSDEVTIWPLDADGSERVWSLGAERARESILELNAVSVDGAWQIQRKYRPHERGALPGTWWGDAKYSATESGTRALLDLFGERNLFGFPKSVSLTEDCLRVLGLDACTTVLDFFAGSGTTGHAVINLNREDGGNRKFILVEMGDYFDTVLLPRLKKVAFTPEWKDGKPKRLATPEEADRSPRVFKIVRLESYEDTLNKTQAHRGATVSS